MRSSRRVALLALGVLAQACSLPGAPATSTPTPAPAPAPTAAPVLAAPAEEATRAAVPGEPLRIRFEAFSPDEGLTLSVTVVGDSDGQTTLSNQAFFSYQAPQYAKDVRVFSDGKPLTVAGGKRGWRVVHRPHASLTINYRLPPSAPTTIDAGVSEWVRPSVGDGVFHLIGDTALLLPTGRGGSDIVALTIDATEVADDPHFVSSFGPGAAPPPVSVKRREVGRAAYLGGKISVDLHDVPGGVLGVAFSGMDSSVRSSELQSDALAVVRAVRDFVQDGQPWYLVNVRGGLRNDPEVKLGGGTGLTNSFTMFVTHALDFANLEDREQFRWVLAHEYFHVWNGQGIRVASLRHRNADDTSVYWFSEGVTEFYAMRLLTRSGLQSSRRALDVLNDKLMRYARNSKRDLGAEAVGPLYYSDTDADQIPYLRGYLAAWHADIAMRRASGGRRSLDDAMLALIERARAEPRFRVSNAFLLSYLTRGLSEEDAARLRRFIVSGGVAPLDEASFGPCIQGVGATGEANRAFTYRFADPSNHRCFRH